MVKPWLKQRWAKIKSLPKEYTIPLSVTVVLLVLYGVVFSLDKPVSFSYAYPSCTKYFTLFPDVHKTAGNREYRAKPSGLIYIGNMAVAARMMCFTPDKPPQPGVTRVDVAPFGGWLMRKTFAIAVGTPPVANVSLLGRPIPASKPLDIPLSATDRLFEYHMEANGGRVACKPKEKATSCDVQKLGLAQGSPYVVQLTRQFNNKSIATLANKKITTLPATRVAGASIKPGETVFAKPRAIDLQFDKQITKITPTLYRLEKDKRTAIAMSVAITGDKVQLAVAEDLARQASYELVVGSAEAVDGSGLETPYALPFTMSGGPKVKSINIGTTSVSTGTAVITFDQPLSEAQDINKAIAVSGGATIASVKGAQVFVALRGIPKCGDFSIKINDTLRSNYDITGGSAWQHTGRTICHTIGTIGYSSRGRAINAYFFGSGPTAVLYTGAIHGSERSTAELMRQWINDLEANARSIPVSRTVVVVPEINPDGVSSGTRTNARNVDLNRNFATNDWQRDITTVNNEPFSGGGGESPMSEPETQAIATLVQRLRPRAVLSYHSVGGVVLANQAGDSAALTDTYSRLSGYRNVTGQSGSTFEYATSGTADDWYAQKLGVPSILIELGSSSYHQFNRNQKAMWAMLN